MLAVKQRSSAHKVSEHESESMKQQMDNLALRHQVLELQTELDWSLTPPHPSLSLLSLSA